MAAAAAGGKRTIKTKTDLPEEVIHEEILTRLPIKSVVRFKSVSKSWLSLFSHPEFVKQHITHCATQNPDDFDFLVAITGYHVAILSRYEETIILPYHTYDSSNPDYNLVGSVNGLICLHNRRNICVIWNPAVHQFKQITIPSRMARIIRIGFGFDPVTNNYKVVVIYIHRPNFLWYASVYSTNSDSWIDITEYEFREWDFGLSRKITDLNVYMSGEWKFGVPITPNTMIKNCPYWTYTHSYNSHNLGGVKFDVGSNKFKLLPRYDAEAKFWYKSNQFGRKFMNMRDRLTLMVYEQYGKTMVDLYSLDEEEGCGVWSKMYSVDAYNAGVKRLHCMGEYLSEGFKYSGEIVLKGNDIIYCYDKKTDTFTRILSSGHGSINSCFTYTPSLAFLQGMRSDHLQTQTQTRKLGYYSTTPWQLIRTLSNKSFGEGPFVV